MNPHYFGIYPDHCSPDPIPRLWLPTTVDPGRTGRFPWAFIIVQFAETFALHCRGRWADFPLLPCLITHCWFCWRWALLLLIICLFAIPIRYWPVAVTHRICSVSLFLVLLLLIVVPTHIIVWRTTLFHSFVVCLMEEQAGRQSLPHPGGDILFVILLLFRLDYCCSLVASPTPIVVVVVCCYLFPIPVETLFFWVI